MPLYITRRPSAKETSPSSSNTFMANNSSLTRQLVFKPNAASSAFTPSIEPEFAERKANIFKSDSRELSIPASGAQPSISEQMITSLPSAEGKVI